jgi:ABC-type lipoprotein export system ATPase subunit
MVLPTPAPSFPILRAERLEKTFATAGGVPGVPAVRELDLAVAAGEFVAITGASGSGKSTLLHMLGGITRPSAGRVLLEGTDLAVLDDDGLAAIRRRRIGFVFQRYNLLPELSLEENVALPLVLDGVSHRSGHRPDALSGGEQQRGAIARALVTKPAILLADEPTGALDSVNSANVLHLLQQLVHDRGQTVILVTHDPEIAAAAGRIVRMRDGRIVEILAGAQAESPAGATAS